MSLNRSLFPRLRGLKGDIGGYVGILEKKLDTFF